MKRKNGVEILKEINNMTQEQLIIEKKIENS